MLEKPVYRITAGFRARLKLLEELGCDMIRFALPDKESIEVLSKIRTLTGMPIIADIHFDYKMALDIMPRVDKIRINPGNIGADWKVKEIIRSALDNKVCIRIGINSGSLPRDLRKAQDTAEAMIEAAEREMAIFLDAGFDNFVVSLKSSDIQSTLKANRIFSEKYSLPLHLGLTEAGPRIPGLIRSTLALGPLLSEGIGNTIRISLSDKPEYEVIAAKQLLKALGLCSDVPTIVSCPTCGRAKFDVIGFLKAREMDIYRTRKDITIAVMGCAVNGPQEAAMADFGITGVGNSIILFKKGVIVEKINKEVSGSKFISILESL